MSRSDISPMTVAEYQHEDFDVTSIWRLHPPETGGKIATSSPSASGMSRFTYRWLTAA